MSDDQEILEMVGQAFDVCVAAVLTVAFLFFGALWLEIFVQNEAWVAAGVTGVVVLFLMANVARAVSAVVPVVVRSNGKLVLQTRSPNVGERIKGYVLLKRSTIFPGLLCVRLLCQEGRWTGPHKFKEKTRWSAEIRERPDKLPEGYRLAFEFETPGDLPGSGGRGNEPQIGWIVEVASAMTGRVFCAFELHIFGPLTEAGRALKAAEKRSARAFDGYAQP